MTVFTSATSDSKNCPDLFIHRLRWQNIFCAVVVERVFCIVSVKWMNVNYIVCWILKQCRNDKKFKTAVKYTYKDNYKVSNFLFFIVYYYLFWCFGFQTKYCMEAPRKHQALSEKTWSCVVCAPHLMYSLSILVNQNNLQVKFLQVYLLLILCCCFYKIALFFFTSYCVQK